RTGQNRFTTQRKEPDEIKILSGVFEGKTTGTPVGLLIKNTDKRSKDYSDIATKFRPSHADYTYQEKYGIRDYRGGGRASARETAMRVAAGAIARKTLNHFIKDDVVIRGAMIQMGADKIDRSRWDWSEIDNNPFFCPDKKTADYWEKYLGEIRENGESIGAVIELTATNIPTGLGCPVYDKLDADIAKAMMSINAVKGVEIGAGFESASFTGKENADEMIPSANGGVEFLSNNAGGILGGISSGQPIVVRIAVKPTSSILNPCKSIDINRNAVEVRTKGRHDPCVGIRAVPIAEAMLACVLADHLLRNRAYNK
ncbi:MAG: chorismate synthase, partial [Alphaproteobacteria bacterium]|nr:chorismate synthase [Alphaproteobacteria bacterium]